jgi:dihydrolipoamide dehydrogenase
MQVEETIYDLAIIGSGPAGYTAAIRAAQYGMKVALIEKAPVLGGTCLHVGCIPTKALLFNAEVWEYVQEGTQFGIEGVAGATLNWATVQKRKTDIVTKHTKGLEFLMKKHKITVIAGYGRLTGAAKDGVHTVELQTGEVSGEMSSVKAKKLILATGSEARMLPGYKADEKILTNIEILAMESLPKSLVIIGSGAVGVEFASIFRSFGAEITLLEALPKIVPPEDDEVSRELARVFKKRGIATQTGVKVDKIEKTADGVQVSYTTAEGTAAVKAAEKVLVAVGRSPRTENVGIEKTKIQMERGFIKTNEWMETDEPGIFAIGDIVAGLPQLAHVGSMCGLVVAARLAGKYARPVTRERVPGCTYSEPQIGSVGLTEAAAKAKGIEVKVGKFPFAGNSKATILGSHDGFVKVVSDAKTDEILGVHIIGPLATELIAEAVTAMDLEATVESMMFTLHAHPTLSESLLDGFAAVEGMAINA